MPTSRQVPASSNSNNRSNDIGSIVQRRVDLFEEYTGLGPLHSQIEELEWSDFRVGRPLGRGTFSCVNEIDVDGQRFALKRLDPSSRRHSDKHFKRGAIDLALEGQLLRHLDHPNVIRLHAVKAGPIQTSVNSARKPYFLVLDYLDNTLESLLQQWKSQEQQPRFPKFFQRASLHQQLLSRVECAAVGIARGMEYLHGNNVIFRDLKPHNVGFDATGAVKIFDFGVSRDLHHVRRAGDKLGFTGTPRYMANEVGKGGCEYGLPADVYSFGVLLWEICTLQQPFSDMKSLDHYRELVVEQGARPQLSLVPHAGLRKLIAKCWDADPEKRPTFAEIRNELEQIVESPKKKRKKQQQQQQKKKERRGSKTARGTRRRSFLRKAKHTSEEKLKTTTTTTTATGDNPTVVLYSRRSSLRLSMTSDSHDPAGIDDFGRVTEPPKAA